MSLTTTDICNLALSRIGAKRIASLEAETSVEARSCRLHFNQCRDGLLRRHQWDFAKVTQELSAISPAPVDYAKGWQIPNDCVRLISLLSGQTPVLTFGRRGRVILTADYMPLTLLYVSNEIEPPYWDGLFVDALKLSLAAAICPDIAQNPSLAAEVMKELESLALPIAQTADAREAGSGENNPLLGLISRSFLQRSRRSTAPIHLPDIP